MYIHIFIRTKVEYFWTTEKRRNGCQTTSLGRSNNSSLPTAHRFGGQSEHIYDPYSSLCPLVRPLDSFHYCDQIKWETRVQSFEFVLIWFRISPGSALSHISLCVPCNSVTCSHVCLGLGRE